MDVNELFIGLITGIVSGILSSIIVTKYYRWKDRERDRQSYFARYRAFIHELANTKGISSTVNFLTYTEVPRTYEWIHLTEEENETINSVNKLIAEFYFAVYSYTRDKGSSTSKISDLLDAEPTLIEKYNNMRTEIAISRIKVDSLGNESLTKLLKEQDLI